MTDFYSAWSETSPTTTFQSGVASLDTQTFQSGNASVSETNTLLPGGFLVWVARKPNGTSHVHGCKIHETIECAIADIEDLTTNSVIDTYVPPSDMLNEEGYFAYGPSSTIYVDHANNPKILCLAANINMIVSDGFSVEEKTLGLSLFDRPSLIVGGQVPGINQYAACVKMTGGNVLFATGTDTADVSSSSSQSSSSPSSSSSLSSVSSVSSQSSLSSQSSKSSTSSESSVSSISSPSSESSTSSESSQSSVSSESSSSSLSSPGVVTYLLTVTGSLTPDVTGNYYDSGFTNAGQIVYTNGTYYIWFLNEGPGLWHIGDNYGDASSENTRWGSVVSLTGTYYPLGEPWATGYATVSTYS